MIEKTNVPKLRLDGFVKNWQKKSLGEKMTIFRGASPRPQGDPRYYGGKVPRLMIKDATRDGKFTIPCIDSLTEEGAKKSRYLSAGSVVLSCSGTKVAIPTILGVDACVHDGWLAFKDYIDVEPEFLFYLFVKLHERMQGSATTGGVFNNLTTEIMNNLVMSFPTVEEQQKIATFLSTVDKKITLLTEKKDKLTEYKKGVMQQLFNGRFQVAVQHSQDTSLEPKSEKSGEQGCRQSSGKLIGQSNGNPMFIPPTLRFKADDGSEFPDWEEVMVGSFGRVVTGSTPKTSEPDNYGGDKLFISPADLGGQKFIVDTKTKVSQKGFKSGRVLPEGSVCFVCIGSTIGKVAINRLEAITNQQLNSVIVDRLNYDNRFVFAILEKESIKIKRLAGEQAVPIINKTEFSKYRLVVPTKLEQTKIANFLSAIDQKIDLANSELEKAKHWKKGLLQQMFV
jgi:type I restriction enzyme S subunit